MLKMSAPSFLEKGKGARTDDDAGFGRLFLQQVEVRKRSDARGHRARVGIVEVGCICFGADEGFNKEVRIGFDNGLED